MQIEYLKIAALTAGLCLGTVASASEPQEITWDDLVPAEAQFDDPFTRLDDDQIYELSLVAQIRDRLDAGEEVGEESLELYRENVESLESQEVDIDGLLAMREEVTRDRIAKTYLANKELDGRRVRIPGYLLPLEFDGKKINEFLLVPYVGACSHTPPPPPNQIVFVTAKESFEAGDGLFTAVWVDGTMKTQRSESSLSFVDGSSDIPSSYMLEAVSVTPYEE